MSKQSNIVVLVATCIGVAPIGAAAESIAIVENGALHRIEVAGPIELIARGENIALVCVSYGGARHWAKPEAWMARSAAGADELPVQRGGKVAGGGNGMGDWRTLPAIPANGCR